MRSISEVTKAVANGDLSRTVNVDVQGEMLDLKGTINHMADGLQTFNEQVSQVARDVTAGNLGSQASVPNACGSWKVSIALTLSFFPILRKRNIGVG